jgi:hypothetical protein
VLQAPLVGPVPAAAIRDTVRAIVQDPAYHRALRESIMDRFWRWFSELLGRVFTAAGDLPHGRTIGLIAIGLIALLIVARILHASRLGLDELEADRTRAGRPRRHTLADAERLAAAGAYVEGAHALYQAALETLARREGVRLHPSYTSGDYVRALRQRGSPAQHAFRQFARRYDGMIFGFAACDAQGWAALRSDLEQVLRVERAA